MTNEEYKAALNVARAARSYTLREYIVLRFRLWLDRQFTRLLGWLNR